MTAALRPATLEDVGPIRRLFGAFFPPPEDGWDDERRGYIELRTRRAIESDPGGAWVAHDDGGLAGVALAIKREGVWVLSLLGVHPEAQGLGVGRQLFDAALAYGDDCHGGMIGASTRPEAIGLYARAGFRIHPALYASGHVRREAIPDLGDVREGVSADLERVCAPVDREIRGGARADVLGTLLEMGFRLLVTEGGYAFAGDDGVRVLAARDEDAATRLLWAVLAGTTKKVEVSWLDARQDWAFRVVLDAGLSLAPQGPWLTRGDLGPLRPFIPHGALL